MKLYMYILTVSVLVICIYLVLQMHEEDALFIKTIDTYYYAFETRKDTIDISLYTSKDPHMFHDVSSIDRVIFKNTNVQFDVTLKGIKYSHQEHYEATTYDVLTYHIQLPKFGTYQFLDHVQMTLFFIDNTEITLYIGVLEYFIDDLEDSLTWSSIDISRDEDVMTIQSISIHGIACETNVAVSKRYLVDVTCRDMTLLATFHKEDVIFTHIPIFLTHLNQREIIIGATSIQSLRMLSQTEGFHREYTYYYAT